MPSDGSVLLPEDAPVIESAGVATAGSDSRIGWLAVAAAFVALAVVFGVSYNFGNLVGQLRESLGVSAGTAGWVFSVFTFTFLALGGVAGTLADRYGPRPLLAAGAVILAAGLVLTAVADHIAVVIVGYLAVGIGVSCVYVPSVANVGGWFARQRVQAIGVAVTGIGVGTIVGPIVTAALVAAVGWRSTQVWLGLAAMLIVLACAAAMPEAARGRRVAATWRVRQLAGDRTFRVLYVSGFAMGLVLYVPFVFLVPIAEQSGVTPIRAAALISVIGFASTAARVLFGLAAARVGVVVAYKATVVTMWISFLVWLPSRSYWALLVLALVFGAGYGGNIALTPAILGHYYGVQNLGAVAGAMFTSASVGALLGAPLAGLIIGGSNRYLLLAVVTVALATLGTVGPVFLPRSHPSEPRAGPVRARSPR